MEVRWATDLRTITDSTELAAGIFGGSVPPQERLAEMAERDSAAIPARRGGMVVAYAGETPLGTGGVYRVRRRAALARRGHPGRARPGRLPGHARRPADYCAAHGASMALVNARVETSGPILREARFAAYGRQLSYRVPLADPADAAGRIPSNAMEVAAS